MRRILLLLACSAAFAADAPAPKTIEELKTAVRAVLDRERVAGAGIAVVARDRVIWAGGVGLADRAAGREVTAETMFRVGSISKSFVALALAKLQEEGRIDLNATLRSVAPEVPVKNAWEQSDPVRVMHVLEHTAGFDDMHPNMAYVVDGPADMPLLEVFRRWPAPLVVRWPPGTRMSYSNPGYGVAGYLIEKITGKPYDDYIRETVFAPLGMARASFRLTEDVRALLAQGYNGERAAAYRQIYLRPAGDLKASPADMARFVRMMLDRGELDGVRIVRADTVARMEQPRTSLAARNGIREGYGLAISSNTEKPIRQYGHGGGIEGFISYYSYMPEQGVGYVVLLNSGTAGRALREIGSLLYGYATAGMAAPVKPAIPHVPDDELRKFSGYYQPASPRSQLLGFVELVLDTKAVSAGGGKLWSAGLLMGPKEAFVPVSANTFRRESELGASRVFTAAADGTPVLAGPGTYHEKAPVWLPWLRVGFLVTCVLLMISSVLFALIWVPRKVFGRMREVQYLSVRIVPLAAVLSLAAAAAIITNTSMIDMATANWKTVSYWLVTWLFALLSLTGLALARAAFRWKMNRVARVHSLLVSAACMGICVYLAYWDMIGLRLWAY